MKDQEFYRRLSDANDNQQQQQQQQQLQPLQRQTFGDHIASIATTNRLFISPARDYRNTESIRRREEQEYVIKGLPFIIVSTSSLVQISNTCKNLTHLNLSYTSLLHDSVIAETGEYLSTLQRYAVQPGLTHIQIPIEDAIEAIGKSCFQLQEIKIQRCEWVTAHVIWMFAYHCPTLKRLDARRSTKCTIKKLIANVLELPGYHSTNSYRRDGDAGSSSFVLPTFSVPRVESTNRSQLEDEDENEQVNNNEENQEIEVFENGNQDDEEEEAEGRNGDVPMLHFRFNGKILYSYLTNQ